LLRGNTVFGLDHTGEIVLEVWHDSPRPVEVRSGELRVHQLR
jgi:ferric-dicitrate binding protein FerR (iron transport regulator)